MFDISKFKRDSGEFCEQNRFVFLDLIVSQFSEEAWAQRKSNQILKKDRKYLNFNVSNVGYQKNRGLTGNRQNTRSDQSECHLDTRRLKVLFKKCKNWNLGYFWDYLVFSNRENELNIYKD